jgi:histidyl-tRNA synthetase
MAVRDKVFKSIIETFQLHGAVTIDTPVFERKVILKKILQDIKIFINFLKQGNFNSKIWRRFKTNLRFK